MKDKIITAILEGSPYQNRIVTAVNAPKEEVVAELNQMVIDGILSASPDPIRGVRYSVLSHETPEKNTEEAESPDDDGTFDSDVFGFMGKLTKAPSTGVLDAPDQPVEDIMSDSDVDRYNDLLKAGNAIGSYEDQSFAWDKSNAKTVVDIDIPRTNVQIGEDSLTDGAITEVFGAPDPSGFYRHVFEGVETDLSLNDGRTDSVGSVPDTKAKPVVQKKKKK